MKKQQTPGGLAGRWGNLQLDLARADSYTTELEKVIESLDAENGALTADLEHAQDMWRACAKNLRKAREKNRQLWDKLSAREVGSV